MPQINSDGTITIPAEIVRNMEGSPGDEIVFEEWLESDSDKSIEDSKTTEVSVILRFEWERTLEDRAQPLRKFKEIKSEHEICSEIESRMGIDLLSTDICSSNSVYKSHQYLSDREWMCGVYFVLSRLFTDKSSCKILNKLNDIDFSSFRRKERVNKIIEELLNDD